MTITSVSFEKSHFKEISEERQNDLLSFSSSKSGDAFYLLGGIVG